MVPPFRMVSGACAALPGRRLLPASALNAYAWTWVVALPFSSTREPEETGPAPRGSESRQRAPVVKVDVKINPARAPPAAIHLLLVTRVN